MGYFSKQVGRPVGTSNRLSRPEPSLPEKQGAASHFGARVGKSLVMHSAPAVHCCPRCHGTLVEDDGFVRCEGRCGRRWIMRVGGGGGAGRWLDPATQPFGGCNCCRPRVSLVAAEVGAICPSSHVEYLVLPEGVVLREEAAPLGICRCCLPPQPLVKKGSSVVCRNKPQQHYQVEHGEVVWVGLAPALVQAEVTAAIDAALSANKAELTLFGLFAPPTGGR